ncbi:unnamed protein product [Staurois parvus]|uniref:Uncharacterized protein n=1 Tax=Staurois parvus TaxID=386267 RepID=A0ABN9CYN6_9NEOB|nr:unnamed protein product [Staurois parvus]
MDTNTEISAEKKKSTDTVTNGTGQEGVNMRGQSKGSVLLGGAVSVFFTVSTMHLDGCAVQCDRADKQSSSP